MIPVVDVAVASDAHFCVFVHLCSRFRYYYCFCHNDNISDEESIDKDNINDNDTNNCNTITDGEENDQKNIDNNIGNDKNNDDIH